VQRDADGAIEWVAVLGRDISERIEAEERLRRMATHDYLTGLPNRPLFNDRLQQAVARHRRSLRGVAVMFCDLDGFKEVNDSCGHAVGDLVLVRIGERLRGVIRETDTPARVGGDEFVVLCEGITDADDLAALAERIIEAVREPIPLDDGQEGGESVRLGISIGIGLAGAESRDVDADRLLTLADTAMYRAKSRGGNTFRVNVLGE
jgi:diguanylate cyclase (GGDEF)-like protein